MMGRRAATFAIWLAGCSIEATGLGAGSAADVGPGTDARPELDGGARGDADASPIFDSGPGVDAGPDEVDAGPTIPPDWYDPAWGARRKLTFDNAPHDQRLDDFPVLVVLSAARIDYAAAGVGGAQIRFVDRDGSELAFEIERWDPAGASPVWVRVPQIDAGSSTDYVWLYYDAPGASDGQDPTGVWSSDYRAVWHLDGDFDDATANGNHGGASDATDGAGSIGGGKELTNDRSVVSDHDSLDLDEAVTISGWMRPTSLSHTIGLLSKREGCENEANYALFVRGDDRIQFEHYDSGWRIFIAGTLVVDRWQWVAATFDTSADEVRIYLNGSPTSSPMSNTRALRMDGNDIEIGRNGGCGGDYMEGGLDEIRIESVARSATWIAAQHRSMTDAYITYGPVERIR